MPSITATLRKGAMFALRLTQILSGCVSLILALVYMQSWPQSTPNFRTATGQSSLPLKKVSQPGNLAVLVFGISKGLSKLTRARCRFCQGMGKQSGILGGQGPGSKNRRCLFHLGAP